MKIHLRYLTYLKYHFLSLLLHLFLYPKIKEPLIKPKNISIIHIIEFWLILYIICFGVRQTWIQFLVPSLPDCKTWENINNILFSKWGIWSKEYSNTTTTNRAIVMIKWSKHIVHLEQCLEYGRHLLIM